MKRLLLIGLVLSLAGIPMLGCDKEEKVEQQSTVTSPGGETTTTDTHKVESSGENPPANPLGETAK